MLPAILFLIILIILNAVFAASEIALISLNDAKIKTMAESGHAKAIRVENLLEEPSRFLATIQIGITLAGFLASAFASDTFADQLVYLFQLIGIQIPESWLKTIAMILITLILAYFTLVLGELVPKRLAMKKSEEISFLAVGPLQTLSKLTSPFVSLLSVSTNFIIRLFGYDPDEDDNQVTEEEIRMMVDIGQEKGAIDEREKLMINNIFEFDNKTADEIMTHRTEIVALPIDADLNTVVDVVNEENFSRIPVYEDTLDNIVGVLYSKDLFRFLSNGNNKESFVLRDIIRQPYFVAVSKRTDELFRDLQNKKIHIAIIIDEYGGTAGIVTIEDLLEEIVGNIFDEYDVEEKEFDKLDENTFLIDGTASLDDVEDWLKVKLPVDDYETLSGFIVGQLGRIPRPNEQPLIEYEGLILKVEKAVEKRVALVKVTKT